MKINLEAPVTKIDGKEFEGMGAQSLKTVAYTAFTTPQEPDRNSNADQRIKMYQMVKKICAGGEQEFSVDEAKMMKDRISLVWLNCEVVGRAFDLIDPPSEKQEQ